jgi:hypothetical protein
MAWHGVHGLLFECQPLLDWLRADEHDLDPGGDLVFKETEGGRYIAFLKLISALKRPDTAPLICEPVRSPLHSYARGYISARSRRCKRKNNAQGNDAAPACDMSAAIICLRVARRAGDTFKMSQHNCPFGKHYALCRYW